MKKVLFLVLLLITFLVIFYQFNSIPKNLAFDEVEFAQLTLLLKEKPYTPFVSFADGHATLYFYLLRVSFSLFGVTNFALRLPAALFGLGATLMFYLNVSLIFDDKKKKDLLYTTLPFTLTVVFVTLRWFFNFARFGFEMPFLLFLEMSCMYFFFRYIKTKTFYNLLISGLFGGLAYNSYQPGRFFFGIFVLSLILLEIKHFNWKVFLRKILTFLVPLLILALPLNLYLLSHPQEDIRVNQQLYFKNNSLTPLKKIEFLGENISKIALMFNIKGDLNGRHNYPGKSALNPLLGILFLAGIVLAAKNYRHFYNQFFLIYFIFSLIPSLLTYPWENPNMLRTYTAIPSIVYFIGLALLSLYNLLIKKFSSKHMYRLLLVLLLLSSFYEIRTYFKYQAPVFKEAFNIKIPLPKAADVIKREAHVK